MRRITLLFLFCPFAFSQQTKSGNAVSIGACSPANSGNNNIFTINCGIGQTQGKKMLDILNRILANQLDPDKVMTKLDDIKHDMDVLKESSSKPTVGLITAQP